MPSEGFDDDDDDDDDDDVVVVVIGTSKRVKTGTPSEGFDGKLFKNASSHFFFFQMSYWFVGIPPAIQGLIPDSVSGITKLPKGVKRTTKRIGWVGLGSFPSLLLISSSFCSLSFLFPFRSLVTPLCKQNLQPKQRNSHFFHCFFFISNPEVWVIGGWTEFVTGHDKEHISGHFTEHIIEPFVLEGYCDLQRNIVCKLSISF